MYSTRDYNMEYPYNGEGLMNHHRGDGTNYLSRTGNEYYDLSPVCDWQKIPGTTVVQKPELPSEKEIQKKGLTDFVGAATDGKYGVVAFDFKSPHDPLEAKKSWFFFDHEYVCLGAGISAESKFPVATTLNQCLLRGDVSVMKGNEKSSVRKGEQQLADVKWVYHDGIAYIFPKPVKINLSNQAQTGSWFKINHQSDSPKDEISKDVFKLWIDHGQKPLNASYQYIVVPSTTEKEIESQTDRHIVILANSAEMQAVRHSVLNICQVVFYTSGEIQVSENLKIGIDSPGVVMVKTEGSAIKQISVADPSRKLGKIHLTVSGKIEKSGDNFKSSWNKEKQISEISIDLPQTVYAGKSVTLDL
jgi:chondroitin AC lyase